MPLDTTHPVAEKRYGSLTATIWPNVADDGHVTYRLTITRSYRLPPEQRVKDDNGWRDASSLRRDDLLPTGELLRWAYDQIRLLEQADRNTFSEKDQ